uniref:Uncharacterized protein n=1 Tax=Anguilla anguilla TaxID=7936 RepID=A0A0E9WK06_ANGAN
MRLLTVLKLIPSCSYIYSLGWRKHKANVAKYSDQNVSKMVLVDGCYLLLAGLAFFEGSIFHIFQLFLTIMTNSCSAHGLLNC